MSDGSTAAPVVNAGLQEELGDLMPSPDGPGLEKVGDFGGVAEASPAAVAEARTTSQVERAFAAAGKHHVRVIARGTGHSCGGQSLVDGGIQLRNGLRGEPRWVSEDEIELPTGLDWRTVESCLHRDNRAVPVVPSVLDISVGGTLSAGGYGTNTPSRGAQIDHVRGLELVAPNGRTYWCTPDENEDFFRFTLAGLGQLGMITRVRLSTAEHRPSAELHGYSFPSLSRMARSLAWMNGTDVPLPDYMRAFSYKPDRPGIALFGALAPGDASRHSHGSIVSEGLDRVHTELGAPETTVRHDKVRSMEDEFDRNWVGRYPGHLHLWIDYGFEYRSFRVYCEELERLASSGSFGTAIRALYVSVVPRAPEGNRYFPFDIRPTESERTFTCGTYCMVPPDDPGVLNGVRDALLACQEVLVELGGRPYVYGFNQMGPLDWRRAFGDEAVDQLLSLKTRLDPDRVIPPPWDRINRGPASGGSDTHPIRRFAAESQAARIPD